MINANSKLAAATTKASPAKVAPTKKSLAAKATTTPRQTKAKAPAAETPPAAVIPPPAKPETKRAVLIGLLQQPDGATVAQLTERFGWLPHSVRAALTGLRKGGHAIERTASTDGKAIYRLTVTA
jgi:hypothetical protein